MYQLATLDSSSLTTPAPLDHYHPSRASVPRMAPGRPSRPRPSEIAADTKRNFIPLIKANYSELYPPYSVYYESPLEDLVIPRRTLSTRPPAFSVEAGDPVMRAIYCGTSDTQTSQLAGGSKVRVPFICAANERRPGGDWETGASGYEEKLCRRSNLAATLSSPWPNTTPCNYPIPSKGGLLSDSVVVYRGPHDQYEALGQWFDLPVVSVTPTRWPKLKDHGTKYSFSEERDMIRNKIRAALRICLYNRYDRVVIGDFGLGNGHRNPPQELAEIWRDVFLFDPDLRGQFAYVIFAFEDPQQSTAKLILDEVAKKAGHGSSRGGSRKDSSSSSSRHSHCPTDMAIFEYVFSEAQIERALSKPDPRYKLDMITS
ncbi:hypothetical protein NLU13_8649 [Sarocladium strictum]|uniref:Microbial-type PARG catalytic domain-containing protein n=1 Tax=Sarocladium strictum TaxID=5046 RepID=A0AA39GC25_SARSR|nr:hypothetical protein NLU13_8649 [Sarocladium strictum]